MSCPAVEHGKTIAESNARRMGELIDEIVAAGVLDQMVEFIKISNKPDATARATAGWETMISGNFYRVATYPLWPLS